MHVHFYELITRKKLDREDSIEYLGASDLWRKVPFRLCNLLQHL